MPVPPLVQKHAVNGGTALLFGLTMWRLGMSTELSAGLAFIFGGVLLAVIDGKVRRPPTRLVYLTRAGHLFDLAACIRKRKLHLRDAFSPPPVASTLTVLLFHA
jgi:hypothetical protein